MPIAQFQQSDPNNLAERLRKAPLTERGFALGRLSARTRAEFGYWVRGQPSVLAGHRGGAG
jgi:hypothetical protein